MSIEKIMSKSVVTVSMDDTLETIREIFAHVRFHHVLVLDEEDKLIGVISDRDLLKAVSPFTNTLSEQPRDTATLRKRAHQVMTRKPIAIRMDNSPLEAMRLFVDKKISCLPVIDENNSVVGILSWRDIFKAIFQSVQKQKKNG